MNVKFLLYLPDPRQFKEIRFGRYSLFIYSFIFLIYFKNLLHHTQTRKTIVHSAYMYNVVHCIVILVYGHFGTKSHTDITYRY